MVQDESGRVTGVIARDVQGDRHYLRINASKGVILSIQKMGGDALLEIAFDQVGTKRLMMKSAAAHMEKK